MNDFMLDEVKAMKKYLKKEWKTVAVFAAFFVLMLLQFKNVGIYFDDYGYYSLSYCVRTPHVGHDYTFSQLYSFMREHYSLVNGRFLQFFLWLSLFKIGGLWLVRIGAACTVTAIMCLLYSLTGGGEAKFPGVFRAVIICGAWFCIPLEIHRHGTYWFVAFFLYYLPLITLVVFSKMYVSHKERTSLLMAVLMGLLIFVTSWSIESLSVACVAMMGILFLIKTVREKKFALCEAFYTLSASAGTVALLLSPGIIQRAKEAVGDIDLLHRVKNSVTYVLFDLFTDYMKLYVTILMLSALVIALYLYKKFGKKLDLFNFLFLIPIALIEAVKPAIFHDAIVLHIAGLMGGIIIAVLILLPVFRFYLLSQRYSSVIVLGTGALSVMVLAGVPGFPERVFIAFIVCSFVVICDAFSLAYEMLSGQKKAAARLIVAVLLLAFLVPSTVNFARIFAGYSANNPINCENDLRLKEASERIKAGEELSEIHLLRFSESNNEYATLMLYDYPGNWFMGMIQDYYEIPRNVQLIYE